MTTLHLIRHGKASPGKASYDELHPLGEAQARLLGEHFARMGQRFDALYCGPLVRQRDTLRLMREAAGAVGAAWPQARVLDALAEAPIEALMRKCLPERLTHDQTLQSLVADLGDGSDVERMRRAFEALFEYVIGLWASGEMSPPEIETAAAFGERVVAGLGEILAREGEGREVAVVTSNGVIGRMVAHVVGAAEPDRAGPSQRYLNSSRTRVRAAAGGLRLEAANVVDHLADLTLHTFL